MEESASSYRERDSQDVGIQCISDDESSAQVHFVLRKHALSTGREDQEERVRTKGLVLSQ